MDEIQSKYQKEKKTVPRASGKHGCPCYRLSADRPGKRAKHLPSQPAEARLPACGHLRRPDRVPLPQLRGCLGPGILFVVVQVAPLSQVRGEVDRGLNMFIYCLELHLRPARPLPQRRSAASSRASWGAAATASTRPAPRLTARTRLARRRLASETAKPGQGHCPAGTGTHRGVNHQGMAGCGDNGRRYLRSMNIGPISPAISALLTVRSVQSIFKFYFKYLYCMDRMAAPCRIIYPRCLSNL